MPIPDKIRPRKAPGPGRFDRSRSTEDRRARRREQLLLAAAAVFARDGYADASVAKIIERAGVGRQSFYDHFENLEDVLFEVHDFSADRAFQAVMKAIAEAEQPGDRLRAGLTAWLQCLARDAPLARVAFQQLRGAGRRGDARIEESLERWVAMLREGMRSAVDAGRISELPDDDTLYAMACAIQGLAMRYLHNRQEDRIEEAVPILLDMFRKIVRPLSS